MAKASLLGGVKFYKQGETGAIRVRKETTNVSGGTLKVMAGFAAANRGNHAASECSRKLSDIPKGSRGKAMRSCLRGAGLENREAIKSAIAHAV